jgi:hypothetical protein
MVRMTDFPLMRGNPSMKSMVISTQIADGTSRGWSRPVGRNCSLLLLWQTSQARTKPRTTPRSPDVWKSAWRRCKVFSMPSCLAPWACASMVGSRGDAEATTGRLQTVMRSSSMPHSLPRSLVDTVAQSAWSALCSAHRSSDSLKEGADSAISALIESASRRARHQRSCLWSRAGTPPGNQIQEACSSSGAVVWSISADQANISSKNGQCGR